MREGSKHTEEAKKKMRGTRKGEKIDPERVRRGVETRKARNPFWHSAETIEKIRIKATGVIPSEETKQKIRASLKDRKAGLESVANMAWAQRGHKPSEETKEKIKYSVKRYWERKKAVRVKVDQEITDNLSEIREAARHKKERRRIEGGD